MKRLGNEPPDISSKRFLPVLEPCDTSAETPDSCPRGPLSLQPREVQRRPRRYAATASNATRRRTRAAEKSVACSPFRGFVTKLPKDSAPLKAGGTLPRGPLTVRAPTYTPPTLLGPPLTRPWGSVSTVVESTAVGT